MTMVIYKENMKYLIVFCDDNKIMFMNDNGIVDPSQILDNGKIVLEQQTIDLQNRNLEYHAFIDRKFYFVTDIHKDQY
jgi:hypothetical protein